MIDPTIYAIPVYVVTLAVEHTLLRRAGRGYEGQDTAASLSGGLGYAIVKTLMKGLVFAVMTVLYRHRFIDLRGALNHLGPVAGLAAYGLLLLLAEDHCYYWYHRASHEIRLLWAGHVVHHSSHHYNLSTALRQSWVAPLIAPVFWLPLPLFGFEPLHVMIMSGLSLLYQYWIHTELIAKLGPLEWVLNTPSHHRVHHGSNPQYVDRNHAGILIIWDRLYGTFEPEVEAPRYGLTSSVANHHVLAIQTREFSNVLGDAWRVRGFRKKLRALFANPSVTNFD